MQEKQITALGGDGVDPEVVGAACNIMEEAEFALDIVWAPNGEASLEEHGTAPDIAGKNIINPTAAMLSARYMLDYLGMRQEANSLAP